ncbi:hypothetical protein AQUCO_00200887v1 [Aquilegia coerulea]|uniref:Uncharacterized protein n=1 Tax=Aquilegia coerulea TaxID=218851 RepID=A0A2G5F5K3_AQUCA|nr:hypothetical protein AQUCO_00200887v1 [Aquilegia coerulea]
MIDSLMDSDHGDGDQSLTHSEAVVSEGDLLTPATKSRSSSSSSSSSSDSSFAGDFFQLEESNLHKPIISVDITPVPADLVSKESEGEVVREASSVTAESYPSCSGSENVTNEASPNNAEAYRSSSGSENITTEASPNTAESSPSSSGLENITTEASPNSDDSDSGSARLQKILCKAQSNTRESDPGSPESDGIPSQVDTDTGVSDLGSPDSISSPSNMQNGLMMQSPPIQVMERSNDTSTYRIPSHVFARSTTPVEWSVASNESLFSIHVGNNSFSRDQFILMDKSGELGKSGDLFYLKTEDYMLSNNPPPPLPGMDPGKKSSDLGDSLGVDEAAAETMKEVLRAAAEDQNKPKAKFAEETRTSSHRSDGSGASIYSFAFPILTGDAVKSVSVKVAPIPDQQIPSQQVHTHSTRVSPTAWLTKRWWCSFPLPRCHWCCWRD